MKDSKRGVKLAQALKSSLLARGYTLTKAAKTLAIRPDTLRGWISRNRFPQEELLRLAQIAGLPTDLSQLRDQYTVGLQTQPDLLSEGITLKTLEEALSYMYTRVDDQLRLYKDFGHDVRLLFGALGPGDIFAYSALDELPYEVDSLGWGLTGELVVQAVDRGAYFIYFHPSQSLVETMREFQLRKIPDPSEFIDAFKQFKHRIRNMKPSLNPGYLDEHVVTVECNASPFMVPGHKYVLFFHPKPSSTAGALVRIPIGSSEKEMSLHLPLTQGVTSQFLNFVIASLQRGGYDRLVECFV